MATTLRTTLRTTTSCLSQTRWNNIDTVAHMNMHNTQYWAHCAPFIDAQSCHIAPWLKSALHASSHPCMCTCVLRCGCFLFTRPPSSTSFHRSPSSPSWCSPQSSTRGPGPTSCATSAWGPWPLLTTRHPSQVMSPRRTWTSWTLKSSTSQLPAMSTGSTPSTTTLPSTILMSTTTSLRNTLQL